MPRIDDLYSLPAGLPVPVDDGAARHLPGMRLPSVPLPSTRGRLVDLAEVPGRSVVFCYPRTGRPDQEPLPGWNETPGARGCTPQTCGFRDRYSAFRAMGVEVFGLSTQDTAYQREMAERLGLPFEVLSDDGFRLVEALGLPTFELGGTRFVKRLTMVVRDGTIEHVLYPVFPPDRSADDVLAWLRNRGPEGEADPSPRR